MNNCCTNNKNKKEPINEKPKAEGKKKPIWMFVGLALIALVGVGAIIPFVSGGIHESHHTVASMNSEPVQDTTNTARSMPMDSMKQMQKMMEDPIENMNSEQMQKMHESCMKMMKN